MRDSEHSPAIVFGEKKRIEGCTRTNMRTLTKEQISNEYPQLLLDSWCPRGHTWVKGEGWVGKRYDQRPHSNAVIYSWDKLVKDQMTNGWIRSEGSHDPRDDESYEDRQGG